MAARASILARNAGLNAMASRLNSGKLRIYSGAQPATPETAASGTLLAELTLNATAFGAAAAGVITANAITSDSAADATGTAGWFRLLQSDGTTAEHDGVCGVGSGELQLPTLSIVANAIISCSSLTITHPM